MVLRPGSAQAPSAVLRAGRPANIEHSAESNGAAMYYVYILRCADDSLYIGSTQDLDSRVKTHNHGRGAVYTLKRRPAHLVYSEIFDTQAEAVRRERQIKCWSRRKKEALVANDLMRLKQLSKSHS